MYLGLGHIVPWRLSTVPYSPPFTISSQWSLAKVVDCYLLIRVKIPPANNLHVCKWTSTWHVDGLVCVHGICTWYKNIYIFQHIMSAGYFIIVKKYEWNLTIYRWFSVCICFLHNMNDTQTHLVYWQLIEKNLSWILVFAVALEGDEISNQRLTPHIIWHA